jgi:hypothetical protein
MQSGGEAAAVPRAAAAAIAAAAGEALGDCSAVLVATAAGEVVLARGCSATAAEVAALRAALGDREGALRRGLALGGRRFEVHRHHPPLVYGRARPGPGEQPEDAPGVALCGVERSALGGAALAAVAFDPPATSARVVSLLRHFCAAHIAAPPAA